MRSTLGDNMTTALVTIKESLKRKRDLFEGLEQENFKEIKNFMPLVERQSNVNIFLNPRDAPILME